MPAKRWGPEWTHGSIALTVTLIQILLAFWLLGVTITGPRFLLGWLLAVSVTAFAYYGYDKYRAREGSRRVPELVLHLLALAGGSAGAYLGMRYFRHKTIKGPYQAIFWTIILLQAVLLGIAIYLLVQS